MVFAINGVITQSLIEELLSSDHAAILATINTFFTLSSGQEEKKIVDKLSLEELFKSIEKQDRGQQETWYQSIRGAAPYNKLKTLVAEHQRIRKLN